MKWSILLMFLIVWLLSGSALANETPSNDQSSVASKTILRFVTWKADQPQVWEEAIALFSEAYPEIGIVREIAPHSSTAYHDLLTQKLKNQDSSVDFFFMDVIWSSEFAAAGWARSLDHLFPRSERRKFLHATMQAATYQDRIYGIPSRIDSGMLYYRADLLEKYGFSPPKTWSELADQARTILQGEKQARPALRGYSGQFKQYEGLICDMLEFVQSNRGTLITEDGTRSTLSSPSALAAVEFVRDTMIPELATRAVLTYQEPESLATFVQGKAVFHRNWPYAWGIANDSSRSHVAGKVGVTTLPHFSNGKSVAALGGWLYGISAYSAHPEEAWKFIEFMTSRTMQKFFAVRASLAPSRRALYTDPGVLQANPQYRELFHVFQTATPRPRTPVYPMVSTILQRYFSRALAFPKLDLHAEAKVADQHINRFLRLVQVRR